MSRFIVLIPLLFTLACASEAPAPAQPTMVMPNVPKPAEQAPAAPKLDKDKTVLDVALGSPDHTTLVAAVKATDLAHALGSPGGVYTVFAPTNAAFDKLPAGTLDELLKPEKKADLKKIVQHHAAVPVMDIPDLKDGQVIPMSDGTTVTIHVADGKVKVDDANVVGTVHALNGVVHVIDAVLLPPAK